MEGWNGLISRSVVARNIIAQHFKQQPKKHSATRWWSKHEQCLQVSQNASVLPDLFRELEEKDVGEASTRKASAVALGEPNFAIELAAVLDGMHDFVRATYDLEGDGLLAPVTYDTYLRLLEVASQNQWPNLRAIARLRAHRDDLTPEQELALVNHGQSCVQDAFNYFIIIFNGELRPAMRFFEGCRVFNPLALVRDDEGRHNLGVAAGLVPDFLDPIRNKAIPFITETECKALANELPVYLATAKAVPAEWDQLSTWWYKQKEKLPVFAGVAFRLALYQPSSAASERVFSMLNSMLGDEQTHVLNDFVEVSVMLRYNGAWRRKYV